MARHKQEYDWLDDPFNDKKANAQDMGKSHYGLAGLGCLAVIVLLVILAVFTASGIAGLAGTL